MLTWLWPEVRKSLARHRTAFRCSQRDTKSSCVACWRFPTTSRRICSCVPSLRREPSWGSASGKQSFRFRSREAAATRTTVTTTVPPTLRSASRATPMPGSHSSCVYTRLPTSSTTTSSWNSRLWPIQRAVTRNNGWNASRGKPSRSHSRPSWWLRVSRPWSRLKTRRVRRSSRGPKYAWMARLRMGVVVRAVTTLQDPARVTLALQEKNRNTVPCQFCWHSWSWSQLSSSGSRRAALSGTMNKSHSHLYVLVYLLEQVHYRSLRPVLILETDPPKLCGSHSLYLCSFTCRLVLL